MFGMKKRNKSLLQTLFVFNFKVHRTFSVINIHRNIYN